MAACHGASWTFKSIHSSHLTQQAARAFVVVFAVMLFAVPATESATAIPATESATAIPLDSSWAASLATLSRAWQAAPASLIKSS